MRVLQGLLASGVLSLMMFVANIGIRPTCWTSLYQPEVPECLRKNS